MDERKGRFKVEVAVGLFMLAGILALAYLSIRLGEFTLGGGYTVYANFSGVGGLNEGATVDIAGVEVGRVSKIQLSDYEAKVAMFIADEVKLQEDAIASIRTKGLLGEKYIRIQPGGSERIIKPGGYIRDTEPPIDLEEVISTYIFGKL